MSKIRFLLLTTICIPLFAQADAAPAEINYCTVSAAGLDNAAQKSIAVMCNAGLSMKAAIAKYQPDPSSQGGMGGMAGGLGSLFGGSSKPALPPAPPVNISNNNAAPVATSPAPPAQPAPSGGSAETSIYK